VICLIVEAVTGHYGVPGQVGQGGVKDSCPTAPPPTIQGFIESLCGESHQSFRGKFAYGRLHEPSGVGLMLRQAHVWGSNKPMDNEIIRTIHVVTYLDPAYCILVEGPWEEKIRSALAGEVKRYGVLYLGESEDLVHWIAEVPQPPGHVEWLVPGQTMTLPVKSGRGYDNIRLTTATFDFHAGEPHWMEAA